MPSSKSIGRTSLTRADRNALRALLEGQSLSGYAKEHGMTSSAMSQAWTRLKRRLPLMTYTKGQGWTVKQ